MTEHAKLSASSSHRWMLCPGSVEAEAAFPEVTSEYANVGTACHDVACRILDALEAFGPHHPDACAITWAGKYLEDFQLTVTMDMIDAVMVYVDYVIALGGTQIYEERVDFSHIVPGGFGTADCIVFHHATMFVIDLKMGQGHKVYANANSQLMLYALGAVKSRSEIEKVVMVIVQPRLDHIDEWEVSLEDLNKHGEYIHQKALEALKPNALRNPSEYACLFCKAKQSCYALQHLTESTILAEFKDLNNSELNLPAVTDLSEEQMHRIIYNKKLINAWMESVEKHIYKKLQNGEPSNHFKLVQGRGRRVITETEEVIKRLKEKGFEDRIFKPSQLKSITELEKLLTKKGFDELLGDTLTRIEGTLILALMEDERPCNQITTEDFEIIE